MTETKNYTIKVNEKCQGCGICYTKYPDYFFESEDGTAYTKETVHSLLPENIEKMGNVCPCAAIIIEEKCESNRQLYFEILEKLKNYNIKRPVSAYFKFAKEKYNIPIPTASGEYRSEYSSDSSANNAAQHEFENKMYSQIDALILKVITEYRVNVLKPYYSKDEGSVFTRSNQKVSEMINNLIHILEREGIANDIPADISVIELYPEEDQTWKMLNKGELLADEMISMVRREFNSNSYSSASSYDMYWKTDYNSVVDGKDWRGNLKYKDKYHYYDLREAFEALAKDILDSFDYKDYEIENHAAQLAGYLVDMYNQKLREELSWRLSYFEDKVHELSRGDDNSQINLKQYANIVREIYRSKEKMLIVNNEAVDSDEVYITEFDEKQLFFDGDVIKKKYVADERICSELILKDKNFKYGNIYGYDGYMMFTTTNDELWVYDLHNETLKNIEQNIYRCWIYNDVLFYLYKSNMYDRYSSCRLCCCKLDGTGNKTLVYDSGILSIKEITDMEVSYESLFTPSRSGRIKWN